MSSKPAGACLRAEKCEQSSEHLSEVTFYKLEWFYLIPLCKPNLHINIILHHHWLTMLHHVKSICRHMLIQLIYPSKSFNTEKPNPAKHI